MNSHVIYTAALRAAVIEWIARSESPEDEARTMNDSAKAALKKNRASLIYRLAHNCPHD